MVDERLRAVAVRLSVLQYATASAPLSMDWCAISTRKSGG
jgi:hypothetical protein